MARRAIFKNTTLSVIPRLINLLIGFFSRKLIIQFVAVEYLGLSSLYANLLDLLNLSELGIGVAIQVRLYSPLVNGEDEKVANLVSIAQKLYTIIGFVVLFLGFASVFFLQYIIKDNPFEIWYVNTAYLVTVTGIAFSYFCAGKRLYFESNESYYLIMISDLFAKVLLYVVALTTLYFTREYLTYATIVAFQAFVSNMALSIVYRKKCKNLLDFTKDAKFRQSEMLMIRKNLKDVVPMKIGVFAFASTDSIIISSFLGLTLVAIYANYSMIFLNLLSMSTIASNSLVSTFGKMEKELDNKEELLKRYKVYENLQFMFSSCTTVCVLLLVDKFMFIWLGDGFYIGTLSVLLFSFDYYIHSYFQPLSTLYTSTGKFKEDKICSLVAAGLNVGLSLIFVGFLGVEGVILGTLIANVFTFVVRTIIINVKYFNRNKLKVIIKPILQLIVCVAECIVCYLIIKNIKIDKPILDFLLCGVICIVVTNIFNLLYAIKLGYHRKFLKRRG